MENQTDVGQKHRILQLRSGAVFGCSRPVGWRPGSRVGGLRNRCHIDARLVSFVNREKFLQKFLIHE
jgi:hypothetical protein